MLDPHTFAQQYALASAALDYLTGHGARVGSVECTEDGPTVVLIPTDDDYTTFRHIGGTWTTLDKGHDNERARHWQWVTLSADFSGVSVVITTRHPDLIDLAPTKGETWRCMSYAEIRAGGFPSVVAA